MAAGFGAHLAEPADTANLRGRKKRAKTDRADGRHLRELLEQGRLPESWIPSGHILDLRELVRLRQTLLDQRTQWQQRIHAVLYRHGVAKPEHLLRSQATRVWLGQVGLPAPSRLVVATGLAVVDAADAQVAPLDGWLRAYARHQPGCRALVEQLYGVGGIADDPGRARRRPPVPQRRRGGALHGAGRVGVLLGRQAQPGQAGPPGSAGVALGPVRSRQVQRAAYCC